MSAMRVTLLGALLLAVACSPESAPTPPPTLGDAVRNNMVVHIMPLPSPPDMGSPTTIPGARANVLMERYMMGKVKEPGNGSSRPSATNSSGPAQ